MERQKVLPTLLREVLGLLNSMTQRPVASSYQTYHTTLRNAKGRRQLASIQDTQTATGSSANIEETATTLHPRLYGLYKCLYLWNSLTDSLSHQHIFVADMLQQFAYRHLLQMIVVRGLFCDSIFGLHIIKDVRP